MSEGERCVAGACLALCVRLLQRQLAYMLGRQLVYVPSTEDELIELMSNRCLNESFLSLAREVSSPKMGTKWVSLIIDWC